MRGVSGKEVEGWVRVKVSGGKLGEGRELGGSGRVGGERVGFGKG